MSGNADAWAGPGCKPRGKPAVAYLQAYSLLHAHVPLVLTHSNAVSLVARINIG